MRLYVALDSERKIIFYDQHLLPENFINHSEICALRTASERLGRGGSCSDARSELTLGVVPLRLPIYGISL